MCMNLNLALEMNCCISHDANATIVGIRSFSFYFICTIFIVFILIKIQNNKYVCVLIEPLSFFCLQGQQKKDRRAIRTQTIQVQEKKIQRVNHNLRQYKANRKKTKGQSEHRQDKANRKKTKGKSEPQTIQVQPLIYLLPHVVLCIYGLFSCI
jgi:hypothetical protein